MYRCFFKRLIDVFLCCLGLIVCAVPMLIIAVCIKADSKGPVFFKQERLGKGEKKFKVYKFRTMCDHAYELGGVASRSDDPRITKTGAVLRRISLDELPQMINIIKGEMAVIGPRPILDWEFNEYRENERYRTRHNVLPGMFCTVDVIYRAASTREMQFEMDAEYVENITFLNDLKIFFGIIGTVFSGKNVYREETDDKNK